MSEFGKPGDRDTNEMRKQFPSGDQVRKVNFKRPFVDNDQVLGKDDRDDKIHVVQLRKSNRTTSEGGIPIAM
jgi:hypothetical protein